MKKKLLSLVLALVMMLSMGTVAMADEATTPSDMRTITITKNYKNANTNYGPGISPKETFNFTLEKVGVEDAAVGVTVDNMPVPTIGTVTYEQGDAGKVVYENGKLTSYCQKDITITLPQYTGVGVYTYKIKETAGNMAGVKYFADEIKLVVTVIQGDNGKIRVAAVHTEASGDAKSDMFTNEYYAGHLSVKKNVTGNLGDQTKNFNVKVTFTAPEGITVGAPIKYTDDGTEKQIEGGWNGSKEVSITLKHDETVTFSNIPKTVTYKVEEEDYTQDGYDAEYAYTAKYFMTVNGEDKEYEKTITDKTMGGEVSHSLESGATKILQNTTYEHYVEITNNKEEAVDTGINLDSMPYILILAAVAVGGVAVISKKRREEF